MHEHSTDCRTAGLRDFDERRVRSGRVGAGQSEAAFSMRLATDSGFDT
jgi:hypothetical protein